MPEKFLQKQPVCVWCVQALSPTLNDGQEREFIYFYTTFLLNVGQIQSKPEIIIKVFVHTGPTCQAPAGTGGYESGLYPLQWTVIVKWRGFMQKAIFFIF